MIAYLQKKKNLNIKKSISGLISSALLFSMIAPPFAQASIWTEREHALQALKEKWAETHSAAVSQSPVPSRQPLLVCVEGASERVHPEWLSALTNESLKKSLVESLLKEGSITGEEYFSVLKGGIDILGVENEETYRANLKAR